MIYRPFPIMPVGNSLFLLVMVVSIVKVNTDGMWISSGKPAQSISTDMASFVSMSVTILRNLGYAHYDLNKPCRRFSSFCCKITTTKDRCRYYREVIEERAGPRFKPIRDRPPEDKPIRVAPISGYREPEPIGGGASR